MWIARGEQQRRGAVRVRAEPVAHECRAMRVNALREALARVPQLHHATDCLALYQRPSPKHAERE